MSTGRRAGRHLVRRTGVALAVAFPSLLLATVAVWAIERYLGVANASVIYLAAVVVTAIFAGAPGAIVAAIASFLLYDFLFVPPVLTFTIADPSEWVSVILLLFTGIVVGELAALQRSRGELAAAREREARALFHVSRELAVRSSTLSVLPTIAAVLRQETAMDRVWIALGSDDASERVVADTGAGGPPEIPALRSVLRRMPGDEPAQWVRVHTPAGRRAAPVARGDAYRVRIAGGSATQGSLWALRVGTGDEPDSVQTRLLAAAADQLGQALEQDRLAREAEAAQLARKSDELKSALLQSVSHDLRTPLATIRAASGTLRDLDGLDPDDRRASVDAIDREVDYLNRLVTNLLDLSRIEAGVLRADRDIYELDDLVRQTLDRLSPRLAGRDVELEAGPVAVEVDAVFLDEAVTNILENALKYTAPGTRIRIRISRLDPGRVRLTIEDAGDGVPDETLPRLFEKFYRVPGRPVGSRSGTGIGLAVVRGLTEATGGTVSARRSELGGLAIDVDLPVALVPAEPLGASR